MNKCDSCKLNECIGCEFTYTDIQNIKEYINQLKEEKQDAYWKGFIDKQNDAVEICKICKYREKYINDKFVSKKKIEDKITKLKNEFDFYAGRNPYEWDDSEFDGDVCDDLSLQIRILKELLEEEAE